MTRTFPLEISLEHVTEETIDQIAGEIEEAVENIRKFYGGPNTHTEDVDIDELLVENGTAAVIWTADDIRKIVPHLNDVQALAVIQDCFRIFNPDETANREMIFQTAERLFPTLSRERRCRRADQAINTYANGDARENLVDLLADAMTWCDDMDELFEEFCATARVHYDAERNPNAKE
jgi:methylglyoxal synthase